MPSEGRPPSVRCLYQGSDTGCQVTEIGAQELECKSRCLPLAARLQSSCQRCGRRARADVKGILVVDPKVCLRFAALDGYDVLWHHALHVEHDTMWCGMSLWAVGVSCPSRVPSQLLVPPSPLAGGVGCWGQPETTAPPGFCVGPESGRKRRACAGPALWQGSPSLGQSQREQNFKNIFDSIMSWFSPSRQLSTTQPLAHSPSLYTLSMTPYGLEQPFVSVWDYVALKQNIGTLSAADRHLVFCAGYQPAVQEVAFVAHGNCTLVGIAEHSSHGCRPWLGWNRGSVRRTGLAAGRSPALGGTQQLSACLERKRRSSDFGWSPSGWRLHHFPGQPVPMLDNPFSEEIFPNTQSKPLLTQLEAISSHPITCYLGEETDPHLSTTSFQVVVESDKVSPQPPFLQAKQPQFPQPLLIRLLLQTLPQLRCPSLDTLQQLNVLLVVRGPKVNTVFEVRPHQCRVQGHDHFPSPAGHTISDTSQDAIGFLGHLGTPLAHIQAVVNQHPQVLFCLAAFQPLFPKPVALHGVVVTQVQDPTLGLVEPHTIDLGPSIQPVQVPLQSLPTLQQINTPTQLGVVCKLLEGALDPPIQIIDKDIKHGWPQHRALGNTACARPPTGVNSVHHNSLGSAIQPVFYPAKSTPVQAMSPQLLQENAVGDSVKGFSKVQVDNVYSFSLIH
ncbi:hypothetical protein QYF61_015307 [Mycteria americana]|uniref:Uncharacterized protein n=1 Tax=Mycteria americana TaxID=33587 RepID=A0AAN7N810_MYCAM|nr:hypothetical protein QYF61_015307 [Mycteria americana]